MSAQTEADMNTSRLRAMARSAEDRYDWGEAARLYGLALDRYPTHHPGSALAERDMQRLREQRDSCAHMFQCQVGAMRLLLDGGAA